MVLLAEADVLAQEMSAEIRAHATEWSGSEVPEVQEILYASCLANIHAGLERILRDRTVPVEPPPDARALAVLSARLDVPLAALLRTYRIGNALMSRRWYRAVEDASLSGEERIAVLDTAFGYMFEYVDRVSSLVTDLYTAERDDRVRTRRQRRLQLVRAVLDGSSPEPAESLEILGYDLGLEHVACIVGGPRPEVAVGSLASLLGAPHRLTVPITGETAWAWIGRTRPFEELSAARAQPGVCLVLGDPGAGVEGFRRSHEQARSGHRVAAGRGGDLTLYGDVALEALVTDDRARVRDFVRRELNGIDGGDARSVTLRETLRAYFAAEQHASAAAAALGVHEHTVSYRLRTVEEHLGHPVASRRAEIETALRMRLVLEAQGSDST
jgi:PucR C-terminal helix-turn-helix domain/GGDEF-like domain